MKSPLYGAAQLEYQEAIRANPADPLPHLRLGQIYLAQGQLEQARECFETVLKIDPLHLEAQKSLAKLFYVQKKFGDALVLYQKILERDFKDPQTHFDLGLVYYETGRPDLFSRECVKALTVDPYFAKAHFVQGILYAKSGKNDKALQELKAGLKINAADPKAHYYLAKIYREQNREEDCIFECMETLKYDPQHLGAHFFLGEILYRHGDYALALQKFSLCLKLKPDLQNLQVLQRICFEKTEQALLAGQHGEALAQFYFENEKYDLAVSFLRKLVQQQPRDERYVLNLAHVYDVSGDYKAAYQLMAEAFKKWPHVPEVQKQFKHAFERYEKFLQGIIAKNPQARESPLQLIELYLAEDRLLEALEEYAFYFEKFPDDFRQKPRHQQVLEQFKKQTEEFKNRPDLQAVYSFRLAHLALAQAEYPRAREIFETLLKQYPSDAGMYYALIRIGYLTGAYTMALGYCRQLKKINPSYRYLSQIETAITRREMQRLQTLLGREPVAQETLAELVRISFENQDWNGLRQSWSRLWGFPEYAREVCRLIRDKLQPLYFKNGLTGDEVQILALAHEGLEDWEQALLLLRHSGGERQHLEILARKHLEQLPADNPGDLYERARWLAFLKKPDLSLQALRKLALVNPRQVLHARFDRDFQSLQGNPEFQTLMDLPGSFKVDLQQ